MAASKDNGGEPRATLDCRSVGFLVLSFYANLIAAANDCSVSENANYIPKALGFSNDEWGQLVGGWPLYLRAFLNLVIVGQVTAPPISDSPRRERVGSRRCPVSGRHRLRRVRRRSTWCGCRACAGRGEFSRSRRPRFALNRTLNG